MSRAVHVYRRFVLFTFAVACAVVVLGAYTRLTDAGLGCPDWPGCYGRLGAPGSAEALAEAQAAYPEQPVDTGKAWTEMVHRYLAGSLGLLVLGLAGAAWVRFRVADQPVLVPTVLLGLVVFQALLGMWTVTLLLKPAVVTAHLLGGFATLALLWWLALRLGAVPTGGPALMAGPAVRDLRPWAFLALFVVGLQIALGGWTSSNYAALACPDFPRCQGAWWPPMDFASAFTLWREVGVNYEYGVLDNDARVAAHVTHRLGAVVTALYLGWLALRALRARRNPFVVAAGGALLALLVLQVSLGIANVLLSLPLAVAVAHNASGAALLLGVVTLNHVVNPPSPVRVDYEAGE
jgi:cytochrome c oxidase assembly protein subunit 15